VHCGAFPDEVVKAVLTLNPQASVADNLVKE
jgi:hypothetical protein